MQTQTNSLTLSEPLIKHKIDVKNMTTIESKSSVNKKLIVYALGIFVSYFYYGIIQEKMYLFSFDFVLIQI